MKISLEGLFRNPKFPNRGYPIIGNESSESHLKPSDISQEKANQILHRLNSFSQAEQLKNEINKYAKTKLLSIGDAQSILRMKVELGEFQDLQHVAYVRRIGAKKFDAIIRELSNQV